MDGRKVITIAHPEQSSGELKKNQFDYMVICLRNAGRMTNCADPDQTAPCPDMTIQIFKADMAHFMEK